MSNGKRETFKGIQPCVEAQSIAPIDRNSQSMYCVSNIQ